MPLPKILQDNLAIPVIGSPLFLVSGPELVIAQCKAGIVGSFPALNARPQHVLEDWLIRIKEELAQAKADNPDLPIAPYAVNQICHASNDRLIGDMELCVKHEVPIIITLSDRLKKLLQPHILMAGLFIMMLLVLGMQKKLLNKALMVYRFVLELAGMLEHFHLCFVRE